MYPKYIRLSIRNTSKSIASRHGTMTKGRYPDHSRWGYRSGRAVND